MIWWYIVPIIGIVASILLFLMALYTGSDGVVVFVALLVILSIGASIVNIAKICTETEDTVYSDKDYETAVMVEDLEKQNIIVHKHKIYENETSYLRKTVYHDQVRWDYYMAVKPIPTEPTYATPEEVINANDYVRQGAVL